MVAYSKHYSGAFGPRPATVLDNMDALELAERAALKFQSEPRKVKAYRRWQIYTECHSDLIKRRIQTLWSDAETVREIGKFVSISMNPGLDITRTAAVVYKEGVGRAVEGATDGANGALQKLVKESMMDVHAPEWNRLAFFLGPITVVPVVRAGTLQWDVLLPHFYDVIPDPNNPMGPPLAASWTISDRTEPGDIAGVFADTIVLDAQSWRYYRTRAGRLELVETLEHGLGYFPGSTFRNRIPYDGDWWNSDANERLVTGTVEVGVLMTVLGFTRKSQHHKLLVAKGDLKNFPKGQKKDPEIPVIADTGKQPNAVTIETLDFDTSPANCIKHARFIYSALIESLGIPDHSVTFDQDSGTPSERITLSHAGLTELRNSQLPFARAFEHDLLPKTVEMMRAFRHPLSVELPSVEQVRDGYRMDFPHLARNFTDPREESEWEHHEIRMGRSSRLEMLRRRHRDLTPDQARDLRDRFLDEEMEWHDAVTSRNIPLSDRGDAVTAAEANGAMGPVVRDGPGEESPESE